MPPKATTPKNFKAIAMINRAIQAKGGTKIPPQFRKPFTLGLYNVYQGYNNNIAIAPNQQVVPIPHNEPLPIEAPPTSSGNMDELSRYSGISDIFRDTVGGASRDSHVLGNMDTQEAPDTGARVVSQGGVMPGSASSNGTLVQGIPPSITGTHGLQKHVYRTVNHFCIPVTTNALPSLRLINGTPILSTQMVVIPWKSSMMYMTYQELFDLSTKCSKWRPLNVKVKLGNFTTHTGNLSASGSTHIAMNYNGVMYESVMDSMKNLGPYVFTEGATSNTQLGHKHVADYFSTPQRSIAVSTYGFYYNQIGQTDEFTTTLKAVPASSTSMTISQVGTDVIKFPKINERVHLQLHNPKHSELHVKLNEDWITDFQSMHTVRPCATAIIAGSNPIQQLGGQTNLQLGPYYQNGTTIRTQYATNDQYNFGVNICSKPNVHILPREQTVPHVNNTTAVLSSQIPWTLHPATPTDTPDIWAFRVVPPPTIDGTDPNIMVQFTIEAELEVEYVDRMSEAHERYVYYAKDITAANQVSNYLGPAGNPFFKSNIGGIDNSLYSQQFDSSDIQTLYFKGRTVMGESAAGVVQNTVPRKLQSEGWYNTKTMKNIPNKNTFNWVDQGFASGEYDDGFTHAPNSAQLGPTTW